ncbi:MAG TPA: molybdenum cofactor guanylyltransferase MobA [Campylobacterales bacterium]|nr:molybdenum cofactor guanylyltransferase MobA [Campylobacterales bacterium]
MGSKFTLIFKDAVAVIVAGGKSSRMQRDKALLPFGNYPSLAEYQYKRLSKLFSKVYISAKENKFDFEVDIIKDVNKISSPLVALVSIFGTLDIDEVFVLSVDAPFVGEELMAKLYVSTSIDADVIVAESQQGLEPLCAIYRRSFLKQAIKALAQDNHRLQSLFNELKVQKVLIEDEKFFMNLNYPKEYEEAKKQVRKLERREN